MSLKRIAKNDLSKKNFILQTIMLLVAIAAVIITFVFGVRSEKTKELQVQYIANLSLIKAEAIQGKKITVSYGSDSIANLSKLLGRLRNTGNLPIVVEDMEKPLTLTFDSGRVLEVDISQTYPQRIFAETFHDDNSVTIKHGLLNPGDWIEFEILVDGIVGWPHPYFRISGIPEPTVSYPTQLEPIKSVTLINIPKPAQYLVLVITSIATLFLFITFVIVLKDSIAPAFISSQRCIKALREAERRLMQRTPHELKHSNVREDLANYMWALLPSGTGSTIRDMVLQVPFDAEHQSIEDLISAIEKTLSSQITSMGIVQRLKKVDWTDIFVAVLVLLIGIASVIVLGGSWRLLVTAMP